MTLAPREIRLGFGLSALTLAISAYSVAAVLSTPPPGSGRGMPGSFAIGVLVRTVTAAVVQCVGALLLDATTWRLTAAHLIPTTAFLVAFEVVMDANDSVPAGMLSGRLAEAAAMLVACEASRQWIQGRRHGPRD